MDRDTNPELDQILERAAASTLASLDAIIDVDQCLQDLYREVGLDTDPALKDSTPGS